MEKVNVRLQPLKNFHQTMSDHMDSKLSVVRRAYANAYRTDKYYLKTSLMFVKRNHAAVTYVPTLYMIGHFYMFRACIIICKIFFVRVEIAIL